MIDAHKVVILFNNDNNKNQAGNLAAQDDISTLSNFFDQQQILSIEPPEKDLNEMLVSDKEVLEEFCKQMDLN